MNQTLLFRPLGKSVDIQASVSGDSQELLKMPLLFGIVKVSLQPLHELVDQSGATLLMVTHSTRAAAAADRVVHLVDQQFRSD